MGLFSSKNPANQAMEYFNQIPGVAQENLGPWAQQGQQAQTQNQGIYNQMSQNPGNFLEELRASYSPSAGYKFKEEQARKAAEGSAAAGGRTSTTANQAAQAKLAKDLLSEDENAYIDRLLGIQGTGLQGNEFMANRGFGAAGDLANINATNLSQQGGMAYRQQENENEKNNAFMKMLLTGGGALLGIPGGPAGMSAGASIGSSLAGGGSTGYTPSNFESFGKGLKRWGGGASGAGGSPTWGGNF